MEHKLDKYTWVIWGCSRDNIPKSANWEEVQQALILAALPGRFETSLSGDFPGCAVFVLKDWSEAAKMAEVWHRAVGNLGEIKISRADIEKAIERTDKVGPGLWAMYKMPWAVWF